MNEAVKILLIINIKCYTRTLILFKSVRYTKLFTITYNNNVRYVNCLYNAYKGGILIIPLDVCVTGLLYFHLVLKCEFTPLQ